MKRTNRLTFLGLGASALLVAACMLDSPGNRIEVKLCDNETTTTIDASKPLTRDDGMAVAATLMKAWQEKHPAQDWEAAERERHTIVAPADNKDLLAAGQGVGHPYGNVTERDLVVWERELDRTVAHGSLVFHDAKELGSTIAVSCDMCHPHASNTHPETYPKYQVQLGKTALVRDMINWCIEHPVRGKKLEPDDPKMRALEAYVYAQRKGAALNYGRR